MKQQIFVTGAAGFVGRHLVKILVNEKYDITSLVKVENEKKLIPPGSNIIIGDLSKKGKWQDSLKEHHTLIHLASIVSAKDSRDFKKNNIIATKNLVEAAKKVKI